MMFWDLRETGGKAHAQIKRQTRHRFPRILRIDAQRVLSDARA